MGVIPTAHMRQLRHRALNYCPGSQNYQPIGLGGLQASALNHCASITLWLYICCKDWGNTGKHISQSLVQVKILFVTYRHLQSVSDAGRPAASWQGHLIQVAEFQISLASAIVFQDLCRIFSIKAWFQRIQNNNGEKHTQQEGTPQRESHFWSLERWLTLDKIVSAVCWLPKSS